MIPEFELDNLLVQQKNELIRLIDAWAFGEAMTTLTILTPLWEACGYSYKREELLKRILVCKEQEVEQRKYAQSAE